MVILTNGVCRRKAVRRKRPVMDPDRCRISSPESFSFLEVKSIWTLLKVRVCSYRAEANLHPSFRPEAWDCHQKVLRRRGSTIAVLRVSRPSLSKPFRFSRAIPPIPQHPHHPHHRNFRNWFIFFPFSSLDCIWIISSYSFYLYCCILFLLRINY